MIALLLAAQLSADIVRGMPADIAPPSTLRGGIARIVPYPGSGILVRRPQAGDCPFAGRVETSLTSPTALYRKGDRPAKGLKNWVDFPEGQLCLVETAR